MTSVSDNAREALASAYDQAGYSDEAAAFSAGEWTCHDHPALVAMIRFEAETVERAAKIAESELVEIFEDSPEIDTDCNAIVRKIATAIRQLKGSGDE